MGQNTQRRSAGRYRNERKRAKKRQDIHAGRIISMQQFIHNTHSHDDTATPVQQEETTTALMVPGNEPETATHMLVAKGEGSEEIIGRGTQYQMRRLKAENEAAFLNGGTPFTFSVRKVK